MAVYIIYIHIYIFVYKYIYIYTHNAKQGLPDGIRQSRLGRSKAGPGSSKPSLSGSAWAHQSSSWPQQNRLEGIAFPSECGKAEPESKSGLGRSKAWHFDERNRKMGWAKVCSDHIGVCGSPSLRSHGFCRKSAGNTSDRGGKCVVCVEVCWVVRC